MEFGKSDRKMFGEQAPRLSIPTTTTTVSPLTFMENQHQDLAGKSTKFCLVLLCSIALNFHGALNFNA